MAIQPRTQAAQQQSRFEHGDFVLYRDPARFLAGKPNHTYVCKVERHWRLGGSGALRYDLVCITTDRYIAGIRPEYMRLLPPADVMHDIDTASLDEGSSMTPAAVAWLRQHARPQDGRPELPTGC